MQETEPGSVSFEEASTPEIWMEMEIDVRDLRKW